MSRLGWPYELLPWAAARYGGDTAFMLNGDALSFADLDERSARFAAALAADGVRPGDRVTVYTPNCAEWLIAYHGALRAGAVVNPVNAMLTLEEILYILVDAESAVLVAAPDRAAGVLARRSEAPGLRRVVVPGDAPSGATAFEEMVSAPPEPPAIPEPGPDDPCSISYTSGTTGHPKGAVQPQRALRAQWGYAASLHGRERSDVMVTALPLAHVYGNIIAHAMIMVGGRSVFSARFDAKQMIAMLAEEHATIFEGVPAMYAMMLAEPSLAGADLNALRLSTVGGQVMPVANIDAWLARTGVVYTEVWGMTELSGMATTHAVHAAGRIGSVGVSLPGVEVRVADIEEPDRELPPGEPGELQVRGVLTMLEYLNRPDATAETILPSGWLRTGDIGRLDGEGNVYVVDRLKDMINTGGFNVYPAEIERVLARHPAVALSAVAADPDPIKGEVAHAYVVLRTGAQATAEELVAHCKESLAPYKVPRAIDFVDDLPKTSTGKIMRRELRSTDP